MRLAPLLVLGLLGGCAQAEETTECSTVPCRASCAPAIGSCVDNRCICSRPDGGGDADAGPCETAACDASCRTAGYAGGGACVGTTCQCAGTPPDGGGETDAGDDAAVEDAPADDGARDETAAEDAADETPAPEVGDPCTVDDLVEQELCGPDLKCAFSELVGVRPDPVCDRNGARALNQACAGFSLTDSCGAGMMCLNDGSGSRCRRLCRDDADCASLGPSAGCLIQMNISGTVVDGIKACTLHCDVLLGSGCDTSHACRPSFVDATGGGVYEAYTDCSGVGSGTQGSDCSAGGSSDCAARYQCFTLGSGESQCLYICETSRIGLDCPAPAYTCNDIHDPTGRLGACL
ncbi:MAG: hypothetical protein HY907_09470 [Deltaproteobacteria bacterium]|nr:hypothetical protein [Deltaproteobacteria bacterium]